MTAAVLVAAAAAVIGGMAGAGNEETDRVYLRSTAGSVLFDHGKHSETAESCAVCHHDLLAGEQFVSCQECHGDDIDPAEFAHADLKEYHGGDCLKCHEQAAGDDQAQTCRECHPGTQENEEKTVGCTECHDDGFTPDMMGHDEYLEVEDHSCLGCHQPGSVSEAYHANCTACHMETSPKRFADPEGGVVCAACHLR